MREWTEAPDNGRNWISSFRKVPAVATIAGQWFDYSGAAGNPVPNYFASSPLVAATLESEKGIYHGGTVTPAKKFLKSIAIMNGSASATGTTNQNLTIMLCDYLLYYPFVDMDAAGEEQIMDNTVQLPRYGTGEGVMVSVIAQAATVGGGRFALKYTNQDGVAERVTPTQYCASAQPQGAFVQANQAAAGVSPFVALQGGDTGVRSVESVTFEIANGGLAAIVLLRPLWTLYAMEECRRTTSGVVESWGSATEHEAWGMKVNAAQILDGAYLNFIGRGAAGSLSASQLTGLLETYWG